MTPFFFPPVKLKRANPYVVTPCLSNSMHNDVQVVLKRCVSIAFQPPHHGQEARFNSWYVVAQREFRKFGKLAKSCRNNIHIHAGVENCSLTLSNRLESWEDRFVFRERLHPAVHIRDTVRDANHILAQMVSVSNTAEGCEPRGREGDSGMAKQ
ncbi:predicted protein [Histoplasma capsulatum var. duboisii H88]|uniref:Predicted protein n=1 Tax=Ajellomyces capsulatus (strain H88) TaxID=544711 RepID=F0UHN4_AJEC8|nr:predicted protein [Histoplasma capsulatum var. duboisii H88]